MALLDELGTFLQTAGVGTLSTTLFKGMMPLDTPSTVHTPIMALIEVPGEPPVRAHGATKYEQPHIQVLSRGAPYAYEAARATAQQAWEVLDMVTNATLSGTFYLSIRALRSPSFLKIDDAHRPTVAFEIRCERSL